MDGVALCARFSLATSRLRYCGPPEADRVLYRAITEGKDAPSARDALRRFEALYPYLEAIGRKHGRDPFEGKVVEAYWIGNELLDAFDRRDFAGILDALVLRGLPRSLAQRLRDRLPDRPIPHHAFHVGFVGVGNVTGHVATTLANIEACRPSWGEVTAVTEGEVELRVPALTVEGSRLGWASPAIRRLPYDPGLIGRPQPGDRVALHWSVPTLRLDEGAAARLERYTRWSVEAANEALPALGTFAASPKGG